MKVANAERAESEQRVPTSLENYYTVVERDEKVGQLVSFMREHEGEKGIVFFLTCACVDFYAKVALRTAEILALPCPNPLPPPPPPPFLSLPQVLPPIVNEGRNKTAKGSKGQKKKAKGGKGSNDEIAIYSLHGRMPQKKRNANLKQFSDEPSSAFMFCTDVAARGLDLPDVDWIVQYDAPQVWLHPRPPGQCRCLYPTPCLCRSCRIPPSSFTAWEEPRVLGAVAGLWCTFARRRTHTCTCCQSPKCQFARRRSCHRSRNRCSAP